MLVAAEHGLDGSAASQSEPQPIPAGDEIEGDVRYDAAYSAFEVGDWDAAAQAYKDIIASDPSDQEAAAGLVRVELMRRTDGVEAPAALASANAAPADLQANLVAADLELLEGDPAAAFRRLVAFIAANPGPDRDAARPHLLDLFEVVGTQEPVVGAARTALANALF